MGGRGVNLLGARGYFLALLLLISAGAGCTEDAGSKAQGAFTSREDESRGKLEPPKHESEPDSDRIRPNSSANPLDENTEGPEEESPARATPRARPDDAETDAPDADEIHAAPPCQPARESLLISEGLGTGAIAPTKKGYLIATYSLSDGASTLRIFEGRSRRAPRRLHEIHLRDNVKLARAHPPAIAFLREEAVVAYLDEAGHLDLLRVKDGKRARIDERLDPRFSPALYGEGDHLLLAYSKAIEGVSRLFLRRIDRNLKTLGVIDLTPPSQSASAPSFVEGADRPLLLGVDARLGFSPVLLWDLERETEPRVIRPISHLVEPAFLRGVLSGGALHLLYAARGIDLSHAIGWFREGEGAPDPASVVPPLGFGLLRADAAIVDEDRLLFVADRPLAREERAPRELILRVLEDDALTEPLALRGRDGSAARPSIAKLGDGAYGLVYGTSGGVELAFIECAEAKNVAAGAPP